jgi:tripartite-type tricarboxylate transporter receptor subunit TctC
MFRRPILQTLLRLSAGVALGLASLAAAAQSDYPSKPVRVLTGFPAGQATDVLGRSIAHKLGEALGQQFYVENRPGAAGIIATQAAMSSAADGYTLLLTSSGPLAVNPSLYSKLPYDPVKDFVPVAALALVPLVLVTNPGFAPTNVDELVALAKAKPGKINYASGGNGVTNHLVMEMFRSTAGISMTHVPYKGGPPALTDLTGGQVDVMFETTVAALPFVKQGRLRPLAVSSIKRSSAAPDVPTLDELGFKGFNGVPWVAIVAPAGTPAPIVAKLNGEINKALATKDVQEYFVSQGAEPMPMSPEEFGGFMKAEIGKWARAVKDSGAKVE